MSPRRISLLVLSLSLAVAPAPDALAGRRAGKDVAPPGAPVSPISGPAATDPEAAQRIVEEAKARAVAIPDQARALIALAFPDRGGDSAVQEAARRELGLFGEHAMSEMASAVPRVRMEHRAALVQAMMQAFRQLSFGLPADYLPGLEAAIWFGDRAARELAIPEIARFRQGAALLTMIDAAFEDPALTPVVARALGQIGDGRARFWLAEVLNGPDPAFRSEAAVALSRIGGEALAPLKDAMRSPDRSARETAARALLPVAGVDDVTALHEYVLSFPDDDPRLLDAMRRAAVMLEEALAAREEAQAATPPSESP